MTINLVHTKPPLGLRTRCLSAVVVLVLLQIVRSEELEMSEGVVSDMINDEESRGIYRLENKNEIKQFSSEPYDMLNIFCHHGMYQKQGTV